MAVRISQLLRLAEHILPRIRGFPCSLNPVCAMSSKKGKKKDCEKSRNDCGQNQFFGGCFKKEEPYRRENKKQNSKVCRDPCKDGPCRPAK